MVEYIFSFVTLSLTSIVVITGAQESGYIGRYHYPSPKDAIMSYVTATSPNHQQQFETYSDRRNFDRDGLMVNPSIASGLYGNPFPAEAEFMPTPSPFLTARNYPMGLAQPFSPFSGYLPNSEGLYYGSQGPSHPSFLMYPPEAAAGGLFGSYGLPYGSPGYGSMGMNPFMGPRMSPLSAMASGKIFKKNF